MESVKFGERFTDCAAKLTRFLQVKRGTTFSKIFAAYAKQKNADAAAYRFVFDGNRISPESTPDSVRTSPYSTWPPHKTPCLSAVANPGAVTVRRNLRNSPRVLLLQLDMEDGEIIDATLEQVGGY